TSQILRFHLEVAVDASAPALGLHFDPLIAKLQSWVAPFCQVGLLVHRTEVGANRPGAPPATSDVGHQLPPLSERGEGLWAVSLKNQAGATFALALVSPPTAVVFQAVPLSATRTNRLPSRLCVGLLSATSSASTAICSVMPACLKMLTS